MTLKDRQRNNTSRKENTGTYIYIVDKNLQKGWKPSGVLNTDNVRKKELIPPM